VKNKTGDGSLGSRVPTGMGLLSGKHLLAHITRKRKKKTDLAVFFEFLVLSSTPFANGP